jgi:hypothetical protein
VLRTVSGPDRLRRWRCRPCGAEFAARRGTALGTTKMAAVTAAGVRQPRADGGRVRATARLVPVSKEAGARWLRVAGRPAERWHAQQSHDLPPQALEGDEQWSGVTKSSSVVALQRGTTGVTWGILRWSPLPARGSSLASGAHGPKPRRRPWSMRPTVGAAQGLCQRGSPLPLRAPRRRAGRPVAGVPPPPGIAPQAGPGVLRGQARRRHVWTWRGDPPMPPRGVERQNGPSRWRHQCQVRQPLACAKARR